MKIPCISLWKKEVRWLDGVGRGREPKSPAAVLYLAQIIERKGISWEKAMGCWFRTTKELALDCQLRVEGFCLCCACTLREGHYFINCFVCVCCKTFGRFNSEQGGTMSSCKFVLIDIVWRLQAKENWVCVEVADPRREGREHNWANCVWGKRAQLSPPSKHSVF